MKTSEVQDNERSKKIEGDTCEKPKGFGFRHVQVILIFLCVTIAYAERVNMSVAIVAMTDRNSTNPDFPDYDWNEKEKSLVLSSFFWGYVITQIPGGQLAKRVGGKVMLLVSITLCSLLNLLTPTFALYGDWPAIVCLRVVQGLCQGVIFPSTHTLLAKWAPPSERGTISTYCYAGAQFGTVVMLAISGVLASSAMGWPSIFYSSGVAGLVWSVLYFFYGSSSPSDCAQRISPEEKHFIESSLNVTGDHGGRPIATPWKALLTSPAVIALIVVHSAHNWGFWTMLTEIPSYMKNVLHFNIKQNALLSALPYFAMMVMSLILSPLADWMNNKQILRVEVSRKVFNTIGLWGPMCALIALAYVTSKEHSALAVTLVTIAVGINAATYLGFQINHLDLAPNHSGTLMGITNCSANIMSIIAPLLVGAIVTDASDPFLWRIIFFIAAGIYFFGNLQFIIFGKANIQPWNDPEAERKRNDGVENPAMEY
ncbi:CLUMA_CG017288, isoform A [Clunio marinus]|uniref:Putative inorganic phosphate cotransporter n=1 Tax=Clunio marinus TaxID=568069 RepID=A0A1J1IVE3_9DIPT|nr:CLUMA_CG017288, isoform A [Clunio marinus]